MDIRVCKGCAEHAGLIVVGDGTGKEEGRYCSELACVKKAVLAAKQDPSFRLIVLEDRLELGRFVLGEWVDAMQMAINSERNLLSVGRLCTYPGQGSHGQCALPITRRHRCSTHTGC